MVLALNLLGCISHRGDSTAKLWGGEKVGFRVDFNGGEEKELRNVCF